MSREVIYFSREVRKVSGEVEDVSRQNLWMADRDEAPMGEIFGLMDEQKNSACEQKSSACEVKTTAHRKKLRRVSKKVRRAR